MSTGTNIFSLEGKTALVTGATGHLGSVIARILAEAGARVYINSRSASKVNKLLTEFHTAGLNAEPAVFDITDEHQLSEFFRSKSDLALDILINNAYGGGAGTVKTSKPTSYSYSYDISLVATHNLLQHALGGLRNAVKRRGDASVINIASMYALVSPDLRNYESPEVSNPPFYGAAKAALIQWTRYCACEFGMEGIRFNALSPGPFPNDDVQREFPEFIERLQAKVPLGRIGITDDIQGPALFLASAASKYVNGANLVVDGGWTAW